MGNPNIGAPTTTEKVVPPISLIEAGVLNWVNNAFTESTKEPKIFTLTEILGLYKDALLNAAQRSQHRKVRASAVALEKRTEFDSFAAQLINALASSEAKNTFWNYGISTLVDGVTQNMEKFPIKQGTLSYQCTTLNPRNKSNALHLKFAVAPLKAKDITFAEVMRVFSLTEDYRIFKGIAALKILPVESSQQVFIDTTVVIVETQIPGMFLMLAMEKSEKKGFVAAQPAFAFVNYDRELTIVE